MIVWLIGLSGAGKTTVGSLLYKGLKPAHPNLVFLDGDNLRDVWGDNLGHTIAARNVNASRISHLCRLLDQQDVHVIAAVLSIFPDWQRWNRAHFSSYYQVFLDVPMSLVRQRDPRGLYAKADAGLVTNVVGVDLAFPPPVGNDLVLSETQLSGTPQSVAEKIALALPPPLAGDR